MIISTFKLCDSGRERSFKHYTQTQTHTHICAHRHVFYLDQIHSQSTHTDAVTYEVLLTIKLCDSGKERSMHTQTHVHTDAHMQTHAHKCKQAH